MNRCASRNPLHAKAATTSADVQLAVEADYLLNNRHHLHASLIYDNNFHYDDDDDDGGNVFV